MKPFLGENYLLSNSTAQALYHDTAKNLPIIDYHNHLSPEEVAQDKHYDNFTEVWLGGDHYKWRAMRWAGVSEEYITGKADPYEKFLAWAKVVPLTLRNPLYAWSHMELRHYFGITDLLSEKTAKSIWDQANEKLKTLSIRKMLDAYKVITLATTDDPIDDLRFHKSYQNHPDSKKMAMIPTFRPDALYVRAHNPQWWNEWADALEKNTNSKIDNYDSLFAAIKVSRQNFAQLGCRSTDHGIQSLPCIKFDTTCEKQANNAVLKLRLGQTPSSEEIDALSLSFIIHNTSEDFKDGWTTQLHLGAQRNVNTEMMNKLGLNTGYDIMSEANQIPGLINVLDTLNSLKTLPQMVLYNLNPIHNAALAVIAGSYQSHANQRNPGHIQYGSSWWFLDQEDGMRRQMNDLSNYGLLSSFIGMLTDSRSPLSFVRHEMFRRILCDLIGTDVEQGKIPNDTQLIHQMVSNICFHNTKQFFGFTTSNN